MYTRFVMRRIAHKDNFLLIERWPSVYCEKSVRARKQNIYQVTPSMLSKAHFTQEKLRAHLLDDNQN